MTKKCFKITGIHTQGKGKGKRMDVSEMFNNRKKANKFKKDIEDVNKIMKPKFIIRLKLEECKKKKK